MRKYLLLALLLYDIVAVWTGAVNYDYDEGIKRHPLGDEGPNWRKKLPTRPSELNNNDWDDRRRHDYDNRRYLDDVKGSEDRRAADSNYNKHFDEVDKLISRGTSCELEHQTYIDKEPEKKIRALNCDRPHERYESCFAGCASVSCDNPRDRLRPCYPFCEPGCVCEPPYVRDDRTHKCVPPDECTRGLKGIPDLDET